jgi:hypothetical protein
MANRKNCQLSSTSFQRVFSCDRLLWFTLFRRYEDRLYAPATPNPKNTQPNTSASHGLTIVLRPKGTVVPFFAAISDHTMSISPITIIMKGR